MDVTADVVIIGGGAIGSATAYFLASAMPAPARVLVLERDPTYARASTPKATGIVRQQYGVPENIRMSAFGAEFFAAAPELLAVDGQPADIGYAERGYVWLVTPQHLAAVKAMHAVQLANGADVTFVPVEKLAERLPGYRADGLAGGFFGGRGAGWLDPWALLQALRRKAISLGVRYRAEEAVRLRLSGRRVDCVETSGGTRITAGHVVNAGGALGAAKVCAMAGIGLPVEPRKRSVFHVEARIDVRAFPMTVYPSNGVWFRPEGRGLLCGVAPLPEDDPATESEDVDDALFEDVIWPTMAGLVPALEELRIARSYTGFYDFNTLDENAILGRLPGFENLLVATGFSGHGVMQSPAAGRAIAELIIHGGFRTLDLARFGYGRIARGEALPEPACF